ncbi:hypothetical protein ACOMHN_063958 [Nucella lapillus]
MVMMQVEREKLRTEEIATKTLYDRSAFDRITQRLEEDNEALKLQLQQLQSQLADAEQRHAQRLVDLNTRHRAETEMEMERLRSSQIQAEKMMEARERCHRQKVKGLEEQIHTLKDQLGQELRRRQHNMTKVARTRDELFDSRSVFESSPIIREPAVDPLLLEHESRKLDDALDMEGYSGGRRKRSPLRHSSPNYRGGVKTSTPAIHRGRSPPASILRRKGNQ